MRCEAIFLAAALVFAMPLEAAQEASQLLYGTVTTKDGKSRTGPLRWDGEEILWTDQFNAEKTHNEFVGQLTADDIEYLETRGPSRIRRLGDLVDLFSRQNRFSDFRQPHAFVCRFGDIARLAPRGEDGVLLELRNGDTLLLADNSNDLGPGTNLQIFESGSGIAKVRWRDVSSINFVAAPADAPMPWGVPLFGVLESGAGVLRGYIQWDHDERVTGDVLDGQLDGEDVSIEFGDISAIEKSAAGSKVTLRTGETLTITGSNDVNDENRGIYVELTGGARVDVPWREFRRIEFARPPEPSPDYADFANPARLAGTVFMRDEQRLTGQFAFDLDESWDFEMLDGRLGRLGYAVPFRFISRIAVADPDSVRVNLTDGTQLLLSHEQDVSERNDGLLVSDKDGARYIRWLDIAAIEMHRD